MRKGTRSIFVTAAPSVSFERKKSWDKHANTWDNLWSIDRSFETWSGHNHLKFKVSVQCMQIWRQILSFGRPRNLSGEKTEQNARHEHKLVHTHITPARTQATRTHQWGFAASRYRSTIDLTSKVISRAMRADTLLHIPISVACTV